MISAADINIRLPGATHRYLKTYFSNSSECFIPMRLNCMQNKNLQEFMIQVIKLGVFDVFEFVGADFLEFFLKCLSLSLSLCLSLSLSLHLHMCLCTLNLSLFLVYLTLLSKTSLTWLAYWNNCCFNVSNKLFLNLNCQSVFLYLSLYVCFSLCLVVFLSFLYHCLFAFLFVSLCVYLFVFLPVCLYSRLLSVCMSLCFSLCLFVFPFLYLTSCFILYQTVIFIFLFNF